MNIKILSCFIFLGICGIQAQQIKFFVTEYNQANYQLDASTVVGMGTRSDWDWPSFSFYTAIDTSEDFETISGGQFSGPSFPDGLSIPWSGFGYDVFSGYDSLQRMSAAFPGGVHSFSGTGTSGLGNFNQPANLLAFSKLTDRLVTNFTELQAFDPDQPLTISWEPFLEGQGTIELADGTIPRGSIEVWIDYWDDTEGSLTAWSHLELTNLNEFEGLPATQTSVTIPAGTLTKSTNGYTVDIFFLRVDSYEDASSVNGATVIHLRSMDTLLDIWPQQPQGSPWEGFPQLQDNWIDAGNWLGYLNVEHAPWVYSQNEQDYLYIPDNAVFAEGAWLWVPAPMAP